jgi:hypothetical protein
VTAGRDGAGDLASALEALAARLDAGSTGEGAVAEVIVATDLQVHPDALDDLSLDPRATTAALVSYQSSGDVRSGSSADVRTSGGRIVSASSSVHRAAAGDGEFAGALRVAPADLASAAESARRAAAVARGQGWQGDPVDHLLVALVRGGTPVGAVSLDPWPWRRGATGPDAEDFRGELAGIDGDRSHALRLARARKADDGAWATLVSRPVSRWFTPGVLRLGWTPNQVTLASFAIGLAAAAAFATGDWVLLFAGALLLQLSLVLDCVDGDVARYRRAFSATGAWLDASTDRLKEFACYGGLALGAGGDEVWLLAAAMLTLQTVRHSVDYTFTAVKGLRETVTAPVVPLDVLDEGDTPPDAAGSRAVRASERSNRRAAVKWTKRLLHLGIGERWAVISVLAALGRPQLALQVLFVLGLVSFAYTFAGRTLRARAWPRQGPSAREREIVAAQADTGPLPAAVGALLATGRSSFLWVRPALVRLVEFAAVLALVEAVAPDTAVETAFLVLLVVASHHYDQMYRVLQGLRPASPLTRALGLGVAGRLVVVAALAAAGAEALEGGLWVLACALGILFLVVEPAGVLREVHRAAPSPDGETGADGG